jgi:hypothetical protein
MNGCRAWRFGSILLAACGAVAAPEPESAPVESNADAQPAVEESSVAPVEAHEAPPEPPPAQVLLASPTLHCALDAPIELGRVVDRRAATVQVRAARDAIAVAFGGRSAPRRVVRLAGRDVRFSTELTTPDGFAPLGVIVVGDRTVELSSGLCPDVRAHYQVKCLHIVLLGASGEPVGAAITDRTTEWPSRDVGLVGGDLVHLQSSIYIHDTVRRYTLDESGITALAPIHIGEPAEGETAVMIHEITPEGWLAIQRYGRVLHRSDGEPLTLRGAALRDVRMRALARTNGAIAIAYQRHEDECFSASIDATTGALIGEPTRSSSAADLPDALRAVLRVRPRRQRTTLFATLTDACDRTLTEIEVGEQGSGHADLAHADAVLEGDTLHVAYAAHEGSDWVVRLRSGRCEL